MRINFQLQVLPNSTESLGVEVLKSRGFFTHASWYWIGAGALLGFVSLLNITFTLALTFLNREDFFHTVFVFMQKCCYSHLCYAND